MGLNQPYLHLDIAKHYLEDARDFIYRFEVFINLPLSKTQRSKAFVDLYMASECVLKAHIFASATTDKLDETYRKVRKIGHNISKLSDEAHFLTDRNDYKYLKDELDRFNVFIRYSLDSSEFFFPSGKDKAEAKVDSTVTISNLTWLSQIAACVNRLISTLYPQINAGIVEDSFEEIFESEQLMGEFRDRNL